MLKIKNCILILVALVLTTSCSEYNKVLNKGTTAERYKMSTEMYEAKKYSKALRLFEMITPLYKGKPQMERIQYMVSQSYFNTKDYFNAAYYFERFSTNYPKSSKREDAEFLSAKSYYLASPKYSLDQTETEKALLAFQNYIDKYPESKRLGEANEIVKKLEYKLEKKAFEIAKQYYHIGYYTAAITAFDNLTSEFLGTSFREEAFFYKFQAAYKLAMNSAIQKKQVRLKFAVKAYERLKRNYPSSQFLPESEKLLEDIKKEQQTS